MTFHSTPSAAVPPKLAMPKRTSALPPPKPPHRALVFRSGVGTTRPGRVADAKSGNTLLPPLPVLATLISLLRQALLIRICDGSALPARLTEMVRQISLGAGFGILNLLSCMVWAPVLKVPILEVNTPLAPEEKAAG